MKMLGCYSGVVRTKQSHLQIRIAPDLIFVFRGPILRCSKGNLRAEVKRVVWHEVAHWLGYETEEQVQPYIGPHKDFPGAQFALGYGGNGITFATIASPLIPDLISGTHNSDSRLFRFDRKCG